MHYGSGAVTGILIDGNLPNRLSLPTDLSVRDVSSLCESPMDSEIWSHAKALDLVIVTKDADFSHRIIATEPPPRIVHIRVGNMKLRQLLPFIGGMWPRIESYVPTSKLINVYLDRIEVVA